MLPAERRFLNRDPGDDAMQPMHLYCHRQMPIHAQACDVLARLGMREGEARELSRARDALGPMMPGGCMRLVPLTVRADGVALGDAAIESAALAKCLRDCEMGLVMLSTMGGGASDLIAKAFADHRADEAVLLDAAASVAADGGLDFLMRDAERMLRPYGMRVQKRRFSPGYADCGIENQRVLLNILHDQPFGVRLTPSCMLIPEKTVLAIGGVLRA
jgi:hypothetical protein